jgi:hypothetical protein
MSKQVNLRSWPVLNLIAYLVMVTTNILANVVPFNGLNTGAVSDLYPNLFAPAGFTFAIWGVIYVALGAFVFFGFRGFDHGSLRLIYQRISLAFILSSFANALWIFCWHYRLIPLSMILMIVILIALAYIMLQLKDLRLSRDEGNYVRIPMGIYFGWISVATIANFTTMLVSLGWHGGGLSEELWMILILLVGLAIGGVTAMRNHDFAYGAVLIWAYLGILAKHLMSSGFNGAYPGVILTVSLCLVLLVLLEGFVFYLNHRMTKRR